MADVIQGMLQSALGDAARSTKFEAYLNFNTAALGPENTEVYLHVKTTQFPGKNYEPIDLRYKGRSIPIRGQVKYDNTWSCTFYLTEGHELKIAFEDWIESLDQTQNMSSNLSSAVRAGQAQSSNFASEFMIAQMDFTGESQTTVYNLHNILPKSVSAVPVDYSSVGTILEFTVEFSYSHYTAVRVGGVKLPAKGGGGPTISGNSAVSSNSNMTLRGRGTNLLNDLENKLKDSANSALKNSIDSVLSGNFSNLGNIATNFAGGATAAITSTFNSAKSQIRQLGSISGIASDLRKLNSTNTPGNPVGSLVNNIKSLKNIFKF